MDLTGKIIAVMQPRSGVSQRTGNSWMTQEYVMEVPGQYPKKMVFNIFGEDRIKQFNIQMGEDVTVSFDIDAREFNGRWYNDIRAYNVQRGVVAPAGAPVGAAPAAGSPFPLRLLLKMQHLRSLLHRNRQVRVVQTTYPSKVKRESFTRVPYIYLHSRIIPTNGAAVAM